MRQFVRSSRQSGVVGHHGAIASPSPLGMHQDSPSEAIPKRRFITPSIIMGVVIASFADTATEDVFDGADTRLARKVCPSALWPVARRKLTQINRIRELKELAVPPGNRLETLRGNRAGQHSIRINAQYRICFRWEDGHAYEVQIADYH